MDKFGAVENKTLTITADRAALEVEATFVKEQPIDISVTVKGKKVGTTAALAENTQVTLSGIETPFAVNAEGKITGEGIVKGRYTVTVDGYLPKEITLDENLTEIVLEYDLFENLTLSWGWGDKTDLSKQNDGKLIYGSGVTRWLSTKSSYDSVAVSVTLLDGGHRQGVFIRFKGDTCIAFKVTDPIFCMKPGPIMRLRSRRNRTQLRLYAKRTGCSYSSTASIATPKQ